MTMWLKLLGMAILIAFASGRQGSEKCQFGSDKKGNCVCGPDQEGKPDLCCYDPKEEQACHVIHDPMLTSFSKFKIPLFFTCVTRLAHLKPRRGEKLEIFIGNDERKKGAFFPAKVSMSFWKRRTFPHHILFDFEGKTPVVHINNKRTEYMTLHAVHLKDNQEIHMFDVDAKLKYMKKAKIYLLSIGDVKIYVRHPTKRKPNPGVCIVKKKSVKTDAKTKGDGCFVKGKQNLVEKMALLDIASNFLRDFIPSKNKQICMKYLITQNTYPSRDEKAKKKCGVIFYKDKIRECFYKSGPGKNSVMRAYLDCYTTMVSGKRKICNKYKKNDLFHQCASSLLDCEKWPYYGKP